MSIIKNIRYRENIQAVSQLAYPWETLKNKTVLITGISGMIASVIADVIMYKNQTSNLNCHLIGIGRDEKKAYERFEEYWYFTEFTFYAHDINQPFPADFQPRIDFIIHAASNTHPVAYATDPVGTILTSVSGTNTLLQLATKTGVARFVYLSTVEIYGENRGDIDRFTEDYLGYIDCNTLRAGYPEGKRTGEALCQAYRQKYKLDVVIPRLARTYGPTMQLTDSKAIAQFIKAGLNDTEIILKSTGTQLFSYTHVLDAVSAIFCILFSGIDGEAYNIADANSDIRLKDLAQIIADETQKQVRFELPSIVESQGYSKATKALMDGSKIKKIGWKPLFTISSGLLNTLAILNELK